MIDLHTHTAASDGILATSALIKSALAAGVQVLAITDHDTIEGLPTPAERLEHSGIRLINGVEFSSEWRKIGIHVLGLNIDPYAESLRAGIAFQTNARRTRAIAIAERLRRCGIDDALAGAARYALGSGIGRPHFAQYLVACGAAKDVEQAFRKYLGAGKVGDVRQHWADLDQIIHWIHGAGGHATLAHPAKYGLTRSKRRSLIADFKAKNGDALEIISGQQDPEVTKTLARDASDFELLCSVGSDFHRPGTAWSHLGMKLVLPESCRPLWEEW